MGEPQLILWESKTGKRRWSITTSLGTLRSLAFSPDGALVASGHESAKVALWSAGSGALLRTLEGHISVVTALAFTSGGLLASASFDESIRLWDVSTGRLIRRFAGHPGAARAVAFEPDGKHIISGGDDRLVRRWDAESGAEIGKPGKHQQPVCAIAISQTGLIATASFSRSIKLWSEHGKESHLIDGLKDYPEALAISSDSSVVAAAIGQRVQRWETEAAAPLPDLRGHRSAVMSISCSKQGSVLASIAMDGNARVWNVLSGSLDRELTGMLPRATCIAVSPDGALVVAGNDGTNRRRYRAIME
jgi:WD40 repeat protein